MSLSSSSTTTTSTSSTSTSNMQLLYDTLKSVQEEIEEGEKMVKERDREGENYYQTDVYKKFSPQTRQMR